MTVTTLVAEKKETEGREIGQTARQTSKCFLSANFFDKTDGFGVREIIFSFSADGKSKAKGTNSGPYCMSNILLSLLHFIGKKNVRHGKKEDRIANLANAFASFAFVFFGGEKIRKNASVEFSLPYHSRTFVFCIGCLPKMISCSTKSRDFTQNLFCIPCNTLIGYLRTK